MPDNGGHALVPLTWEEILREPYRVLFPLGWMLAFLGIGVWIPYYLWPQVISYPGPGHAVLQIQGFLLCFILGFLMTMLPKVLGVAPLGRTQFLLFPFGLAAISVCAWINAPQARMAVQILHVLLIANFLAFIAKRWPRRKGSPPPTLAFIPMAMAADMLGTVLHILVLSRTAPLMAPVDLHRLAALLQFQAFPLLLILGIGGFLLPKLFGNAVIDPQALRDQADRPFRLPLAMGTGLLASYALEASASAFGSGMPALRLACALRAAIWAWFILGRLRLFAVPRGLPAYLAAARLSLISIGFGMVMPVFLPAYLVAWEHFIYITGFLWLTLSVAARVLTAHGGKLELLNRHRKKSLAYGSLIVLALAIRVAADIWTRGHWLHLACAAALLLGAMAIWGRIFLPVLFEIPGKSPAPLKAGHP